jgi:hypothetical protein
MRGLRECTYGTTQTMKAIGKYRKRHVTNLALYFSTSAFTISLMSI